ncbi:hypothetical protein F5884DRAFT_450480 [Xylogone sp. PMI_703]|nr:hypothetical protein F5884DRAFT_450480 [Xylogone sp. PMI_703]
MGKEKDKDSKSSKSSRHHKDDASNRPESSSRHHRTRRPSVVSSDSNEGQSSRASRTQPESYEDAIPEEYSRHSEGQKHYHSSGRHSSRRDKKYHDEEGYDNPPDLAPEGHEGQAADAYDGGDQYYYSHQIQSTYHGDPGTEALTSGFANLGIATDPEAAYPQADQSTDRSLATTSLIQQLPPLQSQHARVALLDKTYQVRTKDYKHFFKFGRVFSILWVEPMGPTAPAGEDNKNVSVVAYGENAYAKIRRFVVVKQQDRSCSCLMVTSYENKGVNKAGIVLANHGFIYSNTEPTYVPGLGARALKVNLSNGVKDLIDPSLINYSKVYNVEANLKVKDIGQIHPDFMGDLDHAFNKIFNGRDEEAVSTNQPGSEVLAHIGSGFLSSPPTDSGGFVYNPQPGPSSPTGTAIHDPYYGAPYQPAYIYQPNNPTHVPNWQGPASTPAYHTLPTANVSYSEIPRSPYPQGQNVQPYNYPRPSGYSYPNAEYAQGSYPDNTYHTQATGASMTAPYHPAPYGEQSTYTAPTGRDDDIDLDHHAQQYRQQRTERSGRKKHH